MSLPRILVVEDDPRIGAELLRVLTEAGFQCELRVNLASARIALLESFDVLLLDLGLPDGDGLDLCRGIRRAGSSLPILVLTARDAPDARVRGLELGADDYVTKPCHMPELLARIRGLLRRSGVHDGGDICRFGALWVDTKKRIAGCGETLFSLRRREFELLEFLLTHPERPWTRDQLLERVWGRDSNASERTIDSCVRRIRQQIEERPSRPKILVTEFGVGYRLKGPTSESI